MELEQCDLNLFKNNSGHFIIKFDTSKESIDAATLANALGAYKRTILSLTENCHDNEMLLVEVDGVNKGCLEIHTILTVVQSVLNPDTLPVIVDGIKALVNLYKFLKGFPAKKVVALDSNNKESMNQVVITNADNATIVINNNVYNTYANSDTPPFGDSRYYAQDKISSVRMLDDSNREYVRIDKSEFGSFEKRRHRVDEEGCEDTQEMLDLIVAKIPLDAPKNQWGFIYEGRRINAKIKDENFIDDVNQHKVTFGKGDGIQARVLIHKEYDCSLNSVVIRSYTILKVLGYTRRIS